MRHRTHSLLRARKLPDTRGFQRTQGPSEIHPGSAGILAVRQGLGPGGEEGLARADEVRALIAW
jgi:hypothetical protein